MVKKKKKGKANPVQARELLEVEVFRIFSYSAHQGGKVASPVHQWPLLPRKISCTISVRGWFDTRAIVRPESLSQ